MPLITLNDLGKVGYISDKVDYNQTLYALSFAENARPSNGNMAKIKGHEDVFGTPPINPMWGLPWKDAGAAYWLYTSGTKCYRVTGVTHTEITRASGDYSGDNDSIWTGTVIGGVPIITNNKALDVPQQWDAGTSKMKDLNNWPAATFARVIRSYKDFVVALDLVVSGADAPYIIKWSDATVPGTVPSSWDPADATKKAGEFPLADSPGGLVDCLKLGPSNIIYKTDAVWAMSFVGGNSVFRFDPLFDTFGLLTARAVAAIGSKNAEKHVLVTEGDVVIHNGSTSESIIDAKHKRYLFANIDDTNIHKVFVQRIAGTEEVWICFNSSGGTDTFPDAALVWNYKDNAWGARDLDKLAYINNGIIDTSGISEIIDDDTGIINLDTSIIDEKTLVKSKQQPVGFSPLNTKLQRLDVGGDFSGTSFRTTMQRTGLPIAGQTMDGSITVDVESRKFVKHLYPKMVGSGVVKWYIGGQETLNGPITWVGPFDFDIEVDSRIDFALNTKFIGYKVEADIDTHWELIGVSIDVQIIGKVRK